ncbi:MAG: hypothetical protein WC919_01060 [Candidatus Paceibacterota bacterium]|jgi:hypothetical protein
MGGTRWSDDHYKDRATVRATTGKPTFAYDSAMKSAPVSARKVNDLLNPFGVKFRESRDSEAHPTSLAIGVMFDETGSMARVPVQFQTALPQLMGLLMRKGVVEHPQVLIGAFGDASGGGEVAPLQVGQFESGIEIEDCLTNIYLEGQGGGQNTESYELAMYFMARHTALDCFEKRNKKGYLFLTGDELYYPQVKADEVKRLIGDTLQENIPVETIMEELQTMYDVYFLIPRGTNHYNAPWLLEGWQKLLGQQVLRLDDPDAISEVIASTISLAEGYDLDSVGRNLDDAGVSKDRRASITKALVPLADSAGHKLVKGSVSGTGLARV